MKTNLKAIYLITLLALGSAGGALAETINLTNIEANLQAGATVRNTSGDNVTIISIPNSTFEKRIAVTGPLVYRVGDTDQFGWFFHNNDGLYCNSKQTLSVLGLFAGDKVKVTYDYHTTSGNGSTTIKSSNVQNVNSGAALTSGQEYTMSANGSFDLNIGKYTRIKSINITPANTNNRIAFDYSGTNQTATYNGQTLPFYRCRLSSRDFVEPCLSVYPSTADVTYSIETKEEPDSKRPAILKNGSEHDIMMLNQGICKVTASSNGNSASYFLEIYDDIASHSVTDIEGGKKYTLTGPGRILNRTITDVPGIEMTFSVTESGEEPNTAVVYKDGAHYVTFTNSDDGWWDRSPRNNYSSPNNGTFYAFKATAKGKLRFGGIKKNPASDSQYAPGKVYLVKIDSPNNYPQAKIFSDEQYGYLDNTNMSPEYNNNHYSISQEGGYIEMETGVVYYLQGEANGEANPKRYAPFLLEWFSYELDGNVQMNKTYAVADITGYAIGNNGTYTANDVNVSGENISIGTPQFKGSVSGASVTIENGHLKFSNITFSKSGENKMGGAIRVHLSSGGDSFDFTLTIPYGKHVWDFRKTGMQSETNPGDWSYSEEQLVTMMKGNSSNLTLVWKVQSADRQELIDPILAANNNVAGDNAFYLDNTAGLVFSTGARSFGVHDTRTIPATASYSDKLAYNASETTTGDLLWLKGNATVYFPGVTSGQYIKVYTLRHSDYKGERFKANNLVDLDGVAYDGSKEFVMRGMWEDRPIGYSGDIMKGAAIFRVPANYQATTDFASIPQLTLSDDGWARVYRIEIMDEFVPDIILADDNVDAHCPVDFDGEFGSVVLRKKGSTTTPVTRTYLATTGQTRCQHANTCDYEIIAEEGVVDVTRTIWNSKAGDNIADTEKRKQGVDYNKLTLSFKKAGLVHIVQRERGSFSGISVSTEDPSQQGFHDAVGYVIDKNEYFIAVGELTVQDYPYTWDFSAHNMYQGSSTTKNNLSKSNSNWTANGDTNSQNAKSTQKFGTIDNQTEQEAYSSKAFFAQGAELRNSLGDVIAETEGLGISRPSTNRLYNYLLTVDGTFGVQSRYYKAYDLQNGAITIDGNDLTGMGEITIPEVDNGMYIFVQSTAAPKATPAGLTQLTEGNDLFKVKDGVYLYQNNSGEKKDFVFEFYPNAEISVIAVTDLVKAIGPTGYATESRDCAIDHTYQDKLTNHPVKAYYIDTYDGGAYQYREYPEVHKIGPVTVVPVRTGTVLYEDNGRTDHGNFSSPLLVPAVNVVPTTDDNTNYAKNWLAPSVAWDRTGLAANGIQFYREDGSKNFLQTGASTGDLLCQKFILATTYYRYFKKGDKDSGPYEAQTVGFYRLKTKNRTEAENTLSGNKAYLLIQNVPTALWASSGNAREGMIYIDLEDFNADDEATPVTNAVAEKEQEQDVYYTLSGIRLNGVPTTKGVYICNGKKVNIK